MEKNPKRQREGGGVNTSGLADDRTAIPKEGLSIMHGVKGANVTYATFGSVRGHDVHDPRMAEAAAHAPIPDAPAQSVHILSYASDVQATHADFTFVGGSRFGAPPSRVPAPQPVRADVQVPQADATNLPTKAVKPETTTVLVVGGPAGVTQSTDANPPSYSEKIPQQTPGVVNSKRV